MSLRRPLVSYSSSDDDPPPQKKRKLPTPAQSLTVPIPVDDPSRHQGRVRTSPHVEGQWASFVYVPVVLGHDEYLGKLLKNVLETAKEQVPSLHSIGLQPDQWELHISLTRPTFLRTHQREDFKKAVRNMTKSSHKFSVSFAKFAQLTNDEKTRVFLAVEIGAGFDQLRSLSETLVPTLKAIRQQEFYPEPRFHASIAWALLDLPEGPSKSTSKSEFVTIPDFPPDFIINLNRVFSSDIQRTTAGLEVECLKVTIGKETVGWQLC